MDWFNILPVEVSQKVLSFLDPEDLSRCSSVNKLWRSLCNYDSLWKRHAYLYSVYPDFVSLPEDHESSLEPLCYWKKIFTHFVGNVRTNWINQDCKVHDVSKSGAIIDQTSCDGQTLVISYMNGYVEVYNLINISLLQTIDLTLPGNEFAWVNTSTQYICLAKSNIITLYKPHPKMYELYSMACLNSCNEISWGNGEEFIDKNYRKAANIIVYIVDEIIWFIDRLSGDIHISEIESKKYITTVDGKSYEKYKIYEGRVHVINVGAIEVLSKKGDVVFNLKRSKSVQVNHFDVGKTMIAGVFVLMDDRNMWKEVTVWDSNSGTLLNNFSVFEDAMLRVSLNEVIVLRFGYKDCSVSVHAPWTKQTLWRRSFEYSATTTVYEAKSSFYPITNRYLLSLPGGSFNDSIIDLKTGQFLFSPSPKSYINKYNHFHAHVVVSFICNINGVLLSIRNYV